MDFAAIPRPAFGRHAQHAEEKAPDALTTKAAARRLLMFKEARELMAALPGPGCTTHCIQSGRLDLCVLLVALLDLHPAPCRTLRIATLCYAKRNCVELLGAIESGKIGRLVLLASSFFRSNNKDLDEWFRGELAAFPGCKVGVARSHAKLALFEFADGARLTVEGSGNLRTNSNMEFAALTNDAALHDFYAGWLDSHLVNADEGDGLDN